jgi:esterase/lipase superfamily enzyme
MPGTFLRAARRRKAAIVRFLSIGFAALSLASCAATADLFSSAPAAAPHVFTVFVDSTRKGERGAVSETAADAPRFSLQMISVPPNHQPGQLERPGFGSEDPASHIVLMNRRVVDEQAFLSELATHISGRIGSNRDVLLYVHGFNTSYDEARFRLAQIIDDGRFGGVPVLFTWPAAGNLLDYGAAKESATASRDSLAKLIRELANVPGVGRVHILAHSMGTWLTMEALRENAIAGSPDLNGKLGDVMLAAPDIDLGVFKAQMARLDPSHVSVLVASNDRALSLSRALAGDRPRVGALDPGKPADRAALDALGVKVRDVSAESNEWLGHGTYASAPQIVREIGAEIGEPRVQDANVQAVLGERPVDTRIVSEPLAPVAASAPTPANAAQAQ